MVTSIKNGSLDSILKQHRESQALELLLQLMKIEGPSGGEGTIAERVRERLLRAGATASQITTDSAHRRTLLRGETGNLILKLPGTFKAPRRLFSAHLDTVPICVGSRPKVVGRYVRSGSPNHGIGADDRAGVAAILNAATLILEKKLPHPPLTFCWFVQEEIGLQGARCVTQSKLGNPRLAFNWDGGSPFKLTVGATGGYRLTFRIRGIASHAGNAPQAGVSAIAIASLAIAQLQKNGWHGAIRKRGKTGTSNVGVIQGGDATNVVTDEVVIRAEARSHDAAFRREIVDRMQAAFADAVAQVTNEAGEQGSVEMEERLDYESFRLDANTPVVAAAQQAVQALGDSPELAIANGGVDANWLNAYGIPTVTLGCGQMNPHMVTEGLDIEQFQTACRLALILASGQEASVAEGPPTAAEPPNGKPRRRRNARRTASSGVQKAAP